jgi:putative ABC transport system ATP-binding protein
MKKGERKYETMEIVTVHQVKKYFGKGEAQVKALDGIDLSIEKGKFTAIIGASGSGDYVKIRLS